LTDTRTHIRRLPRVAAVATVLALAVPLPVGAATPTPVPTATTPSPSATSPAAGPTALAVTVVMTNLTPIAPQPGDVVRITGTLHNDSATPVSDLSLQFHYRSDRAIGSRSEFDDYAIGTQTQPGGQFGPLPLPAEVAPTATSSLASRTLAPGATEPFSLSVPTDDLHLPTDTWQVYEIGVGVNGLTPIGFNTIGGLRTFLPWAPVGVPGVGQQTQVAWVWPLVDRPHRTVGNTWADDALAREITSGGRLANLLAAGQAAQDLHPAPPPRRRKHRKVKPVVPVTSVPVTWAVDPVLVEDVASMAAGYKVGTGRSAKAGTGKDEAGAWLSALKTAARKSETLALPYADPDVVAAARAGLGSEVQVAINSGTTLLSQALGVTPVVYAWPPSGFADQRTVDTLFAARVSTIVLDGSALPPVTPPSYTPGAHTTLRARDGNLDALLTDSGLSTIVGIGASDPSKGPLAVQRFLAETLMVQAERPNLQRTLVVAPDRRWAPTSGYATSLLTDTGKVPWIAPVPLSAALAAPQDTDVVRAPLIYPPTARHAELSRSYLAEVAALKGQTDTFASILATPGDQHARVYDDAVLRSLSSGWRGQRPLASQFLDDATASLNATMHKVHIASLPNSFVTLTSHSGTVPITVSNELDTPVSVVVGISSQHLIVSGGGRKQQTIAPHRQIAVDVRAEARTSGVFSLDVALLTPTGRTYETEQLFVRSTAYGSVAILITAGATGVLLLAVIVRLVRRALAARRPAPGPA
jgi:hypothetical protein